MAAADARYVTRQASAGVADPARVTFTGSLKGRRRVLPWRSNDRLEDLFHQRRRGRLMRATVVYAAGDVRVEDVPDPAIKVLVKP
jgi:hypothetical protein